VPGEGIRRRMEDHPITMPSLVLVIVPLTVVLVLCAMVEVMRNMSFCAMARDALMRYTCSAYNHLC
jgi:hypothetical protein